MKIDHILKMQWEDCKKLKVNQFQDAKVSSTGGWYQIWTSVLHVYLSLEHD